MKSKLSNPIDVETASLENDPNYKAAKDKLTELQLELLQTETRIRDLLDEMNGASDDRADGVTERALARIEGREVSPASRADVWQPLHHLHAEQRVGLLPF